MIRMKTFVELDDDVRKNSSGKTYLLNNTLFTNTLQKRYCVKSKRKVPFKNIMKTLEVLYSEQPDYYEQVGLIWTSEDLLIHSNKNSKWDQPTFTSWKRIRQVFDDDLVNDPDFAKLKVTILEIRPVLYEFKRNGTLRWTYTELTNVSNDYKPIKIIAFPKELFGMLSLSIITELKEQLEKEDD